MHCDSVEMRHGIRVGRALRLVVRLRRTSTARCSTCVFATRRSSARNR